MVKSFIYKSMKRGIIILMVSASVVARAENVSYRTNRTFQATTTTIGNATVYNIANACTNLTDIIIAGSPITTNSASAKEYEGVTWGHSNFTQAWDKIFIEDPYDENYPGNIANYAEIFDDPGWIKGTKSAYGKCGAYMWILQNKLKFTTPGSTYYSNNGHTYLLDKVLVGTLGDYEPGTTYEEKFPEINDFNTNYPGCTYLTNSQPANDSSETVKYSFDTTVYYRLSYINITDCDTYKSAKYEVATIPEREEANLFSADLIGSDSKRDAAIKYKRGGSEANCAWADGAEDVYFSNGTLNVSIALLDGTNAIPTMSLSGDQLNIASVQQGDRIIVDVNGCRDELVVVKNFTWNDLQRLGVSNLVFSDAYTNLNISLRQTVIDTIIFSLDPSPASAQEYQRTHDPMAAVISSTNYPNFHSTYTNLCVLDIPSALGIGCFPPDYMHWHMGLETNVKPADIASAQTDLEVASTNYTTSVTIDDFEEMQVGMRSGLIDLLNMTATNSSVPLIVWHTYEGNFWQGESEIPARYVDPNGALTLEGEDPIRNIKTYLPDGGATLHYVEGTWIHEPPVEVWQVGLYVTKTGKIIITASLNPDYLFNGYGQILDACKED